MPRTVESIVACHRAARALRAAGKSTWRLQIDIKGILREDPGNKSPEHITSVANRIACLLRAKLPATAFYVTSDDFDFDLVDTVEMMEDCSVAALAADLENGVEAVEMLDGWLDTIYDWGDSNRVWLG